MQHKEKKISAKWSFFAGKWLKNRAFFIKKGRIQRISSEQADFTHSVLVPAFHNAHSHSFQWAMRGKTHFISPDVPEDDFWSWREKMYSLANQLEPIELEQIATEAYRIMVSRGFASVCEFHYVHHPTTGASRNDPPCAMSIALCKAAQSAGIRLVLVPVAYHRGGFSRQASKKQRRFTFEDVNEYLSFVRKTRATISAQFPNVHVGYGAHSVRAVPKEWLKTIAKAADKEETILHIHASEQQQEVEECLAKHELTPIQLLHESGFLGPSTTLVHATHLHEKDLELIADSGACVCACPTTERDLGDGFLEAKKMMDRNIPISIGTDSHTYLDPIIELHLLEFHERLRYKRRNVLTNATNAIWHPAQQLMHWGTAVSAQSLGLHSGALQEGYFADMIALSSHRPILSEKDAWNLLDGWIFSQNRAFIEKVYVGGI